jgi:2,7-dihydroxy-5-methyl-1-naphthoate 7-O-methyltransferase
VASSSLPDVVAGNVFDDPLPEADAYVLSQILHGWPDPQAAAILRRCAEAGSADVRVLVVEGVVSDPPSADEASFDLFMLTLVGGRQRTLEEFRQLAGSVSLHLQSPQPLATGDCLLKLKRVTIADG